MKRVAILSIDGGGIRGIIPGIILKNIEERIQKKSGNPDARLVDYIDFVAGTSTGGILGCGMLIPDEVQPHKPKFNMEEVVNLYLEHGGEIFRKPFGHRLVSIFGVRREKFPNSYLTKILEEQFGDTRLSQLLRPCIFTAYDIENRQATFFKQARACESDAKDFYLRDVAQATAAAPTYFRTANITSVMGVSYPLIDGGVFANNPAMCAYAEARKCNFGEISHPSSKDMLMLSFGTGSVEEKIPYQKARNFGMVQWIRPLISIMMSGNSETVSHQLVWLFDAGKNPEGYIRIEPDLFNAKPDMDDASQQNMNALKEAGLRYVDKHEDKINHIVSRLIENKT